jgi:threonine dehydratase
MAPTVRAVREPGLADVLRAKEVLAAHLAVTPLIESPLLGDGVMLKLETLQPTGSFKVRGALVAVASAIADDPDRRVVTASAGNHGLGVAYAAQTLGVKATIVVPENSSAAKQAALARFDAELVLHGTSYEESEDHALFLTRSGARFISAYNDPDVIAGQGTIALELFEQVPDLTSIVAPVGGGGLLAGLALAASSRPGVSVCGVEASASRAVSRSVAVGHVVPIEVGPTLADGLAGNIEAGSVTVPLIARYVRELVAADERVIRDGVRHLAFEHGLVAEPSGAIGVGALSHGLFERSGGKTVIVVSGRNVTRQLLVELLGGPAGG